MTPSLDANVFINCYWDRKELAEFCRQQGLSTAGLKADVTQRIAEFLRSGTTSTPTEVQKPKGLPDSTTGLRLDTAVKHYKNDAVTREFFQRHCGTGFRFNDYLRQFAKGVPKGKSLTYGDLVQGWHEAEEVRKQGGKKIGKQFEYNQFSRDFFSANSGKSKQDMIDAWNIVREYQGPNTYAFYLRIREGTR